MKVFKIYAFRLGNISSTQFDYLFVSGKIFRDQDGDWITATTGHSVHSCHVLARVRAKTVAEAVQKYRKEFCCPVTKGD